MSGRLDCTVIVVGAGPCGLILAIELGRRGISTIVLEESTSPTRFPAANATQARTMEHYRRLGFAHHLRTMGLPADYPTDIAYFTRFTSHELARFKLPSARAATDLVKTLGGSWSAAELPHRCSQMYVEGLLRTEAEALKTVSICRGWRVTGVRDGDDAVTIEAERSDGGERNTLHAVFAVGADGSRSFTRRTLGLTLVGEGSASRDFLGGPMSSIYLRSGALYDLIPHPRAWTYWTVNRDRRSVLFAINGYDEFLFHTQLKSGERHEDIPEAGAKAMFHAALDALLDIEIISRSGWNAGLTLVADKFRRGRFFLGGDAAHLFTPTGGLGYNTAVEDAVNLGWKLAAVIKGWEGPRCLTVTRPSGRPSPNATRAMRAASQTRSDCLYRRPRLKRTVRRVRRRVKPRATTSMRTPAPSSTFLASPSAAGTMGRRLLSLTALYRRPTGPTNTSRPRVRAVARHISGWAVSDRSMTRSVLSSLFYGSAPR